MIIDFLISSVGIVDSLFAVVFVAIASKMFKFNVAFLAIVDSFK